MIIKKNKDYDTIANFDSSNSDDNADNCNRTHKYTAFSTRNRAFTYRD